MKDDDVLVVGGGAAGLSAALVLLRARRSVVVVDSGVPRNAPAATDPCSKIQRVGEGIYHDVQRQVVVTWIRRRACGHSIRPASTENETRIGAAMVHRRRLLTAIDSTAPPVGPGAPRRC